MPYLSSTLLEIDQILEESVEEAIEKNHKNRRIVWQKLPKLPSVRNPDAATSREQARAEVLSQQQIVVDRPLAKSARQLIEAAKVNRELEREVNAPNVVEKSPAPLPRPAPRKATIPESQPSPASPARPMEAAPALAASMNPLTAAAMQTELVRLPKPKPKKFEFKAQSPSAPLPAKNLDFGAVPELKDNALPTAGVGSMEIAQLRKNAPKKFQAPPTSARPSGASSIEFGDVPDAGAGSAANLPATAPGTGLAVAKLPPRRYRPPSSSTAGNGSTAANRPGAGPALEAPPDLAASGQGLGGKSASDMVVLGLQPAPGVPPPGASLSGRFSRGPEKGEPAHVANNDPKAIAVPGASSRPSSGGVQDLRLLAPEQVLGKEAADGFLEVRLDLARQWPQLSVLLSPHARLLPRRVEPYLKGRSVFTVVVPIEKMDRYSGDWILWFSPSVAMAGNVGNNVKVQAPLPIWKLETKRWLVTKGEQGVEQRVQMVIGISREGRVEFREMIGRFGAEMNRLVTNDISRWVFQPARVNGQAIDVDAVVEIPFRIPPSLQVASP